MYRALYRKYRPASFRDVVGQEHIVETLKGELKSGRISHAYLFTGPRGTGKTTCAKILAKAVNCKNPIDGDACLQCDACRAIEDEKIFDIAEIDAASNNGVDNIREITEQAMYAPVGFRYRVFIIDEVHMLSQGAFNALLKTLEEPPDSVIFILATTEVQKIPATVLSRCQRFDFRRIESEVIAARLLAVAEHEDIDLTINAADLIAGMADGGMRDALSILDLCAASGGRISEKTVENATGTAGSDELLPLARALLAENLPLSLQTIDTVYKNSVDMQHLCEQLIGIFRDLMIIKSVKNSEKLVHRARSQYSALCDTAGGNSLERILQCLRALSDALNRMTSVNRRSELEMAVVSVCRQDAVPNRVVKESDKESESGLPTEAGNAVTSSNGEPEGDGVAPVERWEDIVSRLREQNPLLAAHLVGSRAYFKDDYILIDCGNPQFADLLRQQSQRATLRGAAAEVLGKPYKLGPYKKAVSESESRDPLEDVMARWERLSVEEDENG